MNMKTKLQSLSKSDRAKKRITKNKQTTNFINKFYKTLEIRK